MFAYYTSTWAISQDLDLRARERLILLALAEHADKGGKCYPSQKRIAAMTGFSVRTVGRSLEELGLLGLLRRTKRYAGDDQPRRTTDLIQLLYGAYSPIEVSVSGMGEKDTAAEDGDNLTNTYMTACPIDGDTLAEQEPPKEPVKSEPEGLERNVGSTYYLETSREQAWREKIDELLALPELEEVR